MKLQHIFLLGVTFYLTITTRDVGGVITISGVSFEVLQQLLAMSNLTVTDTDECDRLVPICPANSICNNNPGSYDCTCETGFGAASNNENGAANCIDINECDTSSGEPDPCAGVSGATCTNTEGSYACLCSEGYMVNDGMAECVDINECLEETVCVDYGPSTCINTDGSFECTCKSGYSKNADGVCQNNDECSSGTHNCFTNQNCVDNEGSFTCDCKTGFVETGTTGEDCIDINECNDNPCSAITGSECRNNAGSYECACTVDGYQNDGTACVDINECDTMVMGHDCSENEVCVNEDPGFRCECAEGYFGDPSEDTCSDLNECDADTSPCDGNAVCFNKLGGHDCFCNKGYFGSGEPEGCRDVLSCSTFESIKVAIDAVRNAALDEDVSSHSTTLTQYASASGKADGVPGDTYRAAFDGTIDTDIINVIDKLRCDYFSSCAETTGDTTTYTCTCADGYKPYTSDTGEVSVIQCTDIDECADVSSCGNAATCGNTEGSYTCTCEAGYELEDAISSDCIDTNECDTNVHNCHKDATCDNIEGSFTCTCKEGFFGTGTECQDSYTCTTFNDVRNEIDILRISTDDTARNEATMFLSQYVNTLGITSTVPGDTYNKLYSPEDGSLIANAVDLLICDYKSECVQEEETHSCTCNEGYIALSTNAKQCIDVDECSTLGDGACGVTGSCVNKIGSYSCECAEGYDGGETGPCTDIDECAMDTHECGDTGTCENRDGSYQCVCHDGYEGGDGAACTNIDECVTGDNNCDTNAGCSDLVGSFKCSCNDGFTGDGVTCSDVDECANPGLNTCDENADCTNSVGSYECSCKTGFMGTGQKGECTDVLLCSTFIKIKEAIDSIRTADETGDTSEAITTLEQYASATGKADGVSGNTYRAAFGEISSTEIADVINDLRCDYFSTCAEPADDSSPYTCTCIDGYQYYTDSDSVTSSVQCTDINECAEGGTNNCDTHATCTNKQGGFECACNPGYVGDDGTTCENVDECASSDLNTCDENADCTDSDGSYACSCKTGFMGTGQERECTDVLLCSTFIKIKEAIDSIRTADGTGDTSEAITTLEQYASATGKADGVSGNTYRAAFGEISSTKIADVINDLRCDYFSTCAEPADESSPYTCTCIDGYQYYTDSDSVTSSVQCTDINECDSDDDVCHVNAACTNDEGGFTCQCNDGYFGNGKTCSDHDECVGEGDGHDCDSNAECDNVDGGHTCTCKGGYYGDGTKGNCESVDTCDTYDVIKAAINNVRDSTDDVMIEAARKVLKEYAAATGKPARDTAGSYRTVYGTDIDDDINAVINHLTCDYHATCDTDGTTTTCTCIDNFISLGEEYKCFSVRSCDAFTGVKAAITAVNGETEDSPATASRTILQKYGAQTAFAEAASTDAYVARFGDVTDSDVKKALDNLRCDFFSTCNFDVAADEAYSCACDAGYEQADKQNSCQDVNECDTTDSNCDVNAHCTNMEGSFDCNCNVGFTGSGTSCADSIDCESAEDTKCGANAVCTDTFGSFVCTCSEGYRGDGIVCKETVECLFSDDAVASDVDCADSNHPFSCSFEREFSDIAEDHYEEYSAFFRAPRGLISTKGDTRADADLLFPGISEGICQEATTYISPQKAYVDEARTIEVELFSYSCYRQWFIKTECTATPADINLACLTEYLPEKALIIKRNGNKYEVEETEIYLGANCKLSFVD